MKSKKILAAVTLAGFVATTPFPTAALAKQVTVIEVNQHINLEQAMEIAKTKVPKGGKLIDSDLVQYKDKSVYHLEYVLDSIWYKVEINQKNKKVERFEGERAWQWGENAKNKYVANKHYVPAVPFDNAKGIAVNATQQAKTVEIKLAVNEGYYIYQVELRKGDYRYQVEIDPETGVILDYSEEHKDAQEQVKPPIHLITDEQAKKIALSSVQEKCTVMATNLKQDKQLWYYDVVLISKDEKSRYQIEIDASKGKILEIERVKLNHQQPEGKPVITVEQAKQLAYKIVPKGTVSEVKLANNDGVKVYVVKMQKNTVEYELEIDAVTGELIRKTETIIMEQKPEEKPDDKPNHGEIISKEKAIEIALAKVPGGKVVECELDKDDEVVYEIKIQDGKYEYEFEIDGKTGKIVDQDKELIDTDDDDDEEDDDERDDD